MCGGDIFEILLVLLLLVYVYIYRCLGVCLCQREIFGDKTIPSPEPSSFPSFLQDHPATALP